MQQLEGGDRGLQGNKAPSPTQVGSSDSSSSGEVTESSSGDKSERECDTVPGKRSEWEVEGAAEVKGQDGVVLVEARASRRLAKQEHHNAWDGLCV